MIQEESCKFVEIMLIGATRSGRSTFIERIGGSPPTESPITGVKVSAPITLQGSGTMVVFYEMPGFDDGDGGLTGGKLVGHLRKWVDFLVALHANGRKLRGLFLFHSITSTTSCERDYGTILKKVCGEDTSTLIHITVVMSKWDEVSEAVGAAREYELSHRDSLFKEILDHGARMQRYDNTRESACSLVTRVADLPPVTFRIQREMGERRMCFNEAAVGKFLLKKLQEEIAKHAAEVKQAEETKERLIRRKSSRNLARAMEVDGALLGMQERLMRVVDDVKEDFVHVLEEWTTEKMLEGVRDDVRRTQCLIQYAQHPSRSDTSSASTRGEKAEPRISKRFWPCSSSILD
ncbi:hypothetical protein BXZ70DRAFT_192264 [Cristinia sonorae]|uniref:G domain-containing protein n=1 Tax=Cristinia sonorae TaxID=1940300 RepID=A0A8K0UP19_9AGAR|nr:hypothetical protein BXZ70DRAFT_192264 [Cristinia sonorae]